MHWENPASGKPKSRKFKRELFLYRNVLLGCARIFFGFKEHFSYESKEYLKVPIIVSKASHFGFICAANIQWCAHNYQKILHWVRHAILLHRQCTRCRPAVKCAEIICMRSIEHNNNLKFMCNATPIHNASFNIFILFFFLFSFFLSHFIFISLSIPFVLFFSVLWFHDHSSFVFH